MNLFKKINPFIKTSLKFCSYLKKELAEKGDRALTDPCNLHDLVNATLKISRETSIQKTVIKKLNFVMTCFMNI